MTGYIVPPRLGPQSGQLFQGDIFASVPLLRLVHDEEVETEASLAILLTPTCDFALKQDSERRTVCAVEPLDAATPLFARVQEGKVPLHLFLLPPLDTLFAYGGAVHFRRSSPVHANLLERCARCHARRIRCPRPARRPFSVLRADRHRPNVNPIASRRSASSVGSYRRRGCRARACRAPSCPSQRARGRRRGCRTSPRHRRYIPRRRSGMADSLDSERGSSGHNAGYNTYAERRARQPRCFI